MLGTETFYIYDVFLSLSGLKDKIFICPVVLIIRYGILYYLENDNNIQEVEQKVYLKCMPKIVKNLIFPF